MLLFEKLVPILCGQRIHLHFYNFYGFFRTYFIVLFLLSVVTLSPIPLLCLKVGQKREENNNNLLSHMLDLLLSKLSQNKESTKGDKMFKSSSLK